MLFFLCCRAAIFLDMQTIHEVEGKHGNFKVSTRIIGDVTLVEIGGKNLLIEFVDFFINVIAEDEFKLIRKDKTTNKSEKLISSRNQTQIKASEFSVYNPTVHKYVKKHQTIFIFINNRPLSTIIKDLLKLECSQLYHQPEKSDSSMHVENPRIYPYYDLCEQVLNLSKEEDEDRDQLLKWHLVNKKLEDEQFKSDEKHKLEQVEKKLKQKIKEIKYKIEKYERELKEYELDYTTGKNTKDNCETSNEIKRLKLEYEKIRIKVEQVERE